MKISLANKGDLDTIIKLNKQFEIDVKGFRWSQEKYTKEQIEKGNYFVIKENNLVLGAIGIQEEGVDELYIESIAVDPKKHRLGIGKKLINFAKNKARELGCKKLTVESFQSYNLLSFYQKVGFKLDEPPVGHYKNMPYHRLVLYL